jgi:uncharacterized coiled-coil protein SlyX
VEDRIIELELRYTQQQDELQKLSDVVWAQARQLDRLESELRQLRQLLASGAPDDGTGVPDDPPPHY